MAAKMILPKGTSSDLLDNLDSTDFAVDDPNSRQTLSAGELRVQSLTTVESVALKYNDSEKSLDFTFATGTQPAGQTTSNASQTVCSVAQAIAMAIVL